MHIVNSPDRPCLSFLVELVSDKRLELVDVCREGPKPDLLDLGRVDQMGVGRRPLLGDRRVVAGRVGGRGVGEDVECTLCTTEVNRGRANDQSASVLRVIPPGYAAGATGIVVQVEARRDGDAHGSSSIGRNVTDDVICFMISRISACTSFSVFGLTFLPPPAVGAGAADGGASPSADVDALCVRPDTKGSASGPKTEIPLKQFSPSL